jgi:predicted nucleotidyltransferase
MLDATFTELSTTIQEEIQEAQGAVEGIYAPTELSRYLYPVIILYGSRIKGYGASSADLDVAVFVRPDVSITERPLIQELLKKILAGEKIQGKALEFWLE